MLESFKIQLGKYHKIVITDGKPGSKENETAKIMQEHKEKLIKNHEEGDVNGIIEVLLSLRVNALQIAPELRRNLISDLIKNDIFTITKNGIGFIIELLKIDNDQLKHAIISLVSVIASTKQGVNYLTNDKHKAVLTEIIRVRYLPLITRYSSSRITGASRSDSAWRRCRSSRSKRS